MSQSNPMGWGRMPAGKWNAGKMPLSEHELCVKLADIFVHQTGLAKAVCLQSDPITGQKAFYFKLPPKSDMHEKLMGQTLFGIPFQFEFE